MKKWIINQEKSARRCEICHKTDMFDSDKTYCLRCKNVDVLIYSHNKTINRNFRGSINKLSLLRPSVSLPILNFFLFTYNIMAKRQISFEEGDILWVDFCKMGWDYTFYAGSGFHFYYESTLMKFHILINLPSEWLCTLFWDIFVDKYISNCSVYTVSWITAISFLLFSSFQWFIIGKLVNKLIRVLGIRYKR